MKILILSGYLEDQIIGSSLILSKMQKETNNVVEIEPITLSYLNKRLEKVQKLMYDQIYIVGFYLRKEQHIEFEKLLKRLKKSKITWIIPNYDDLNIGDFAKYADFHPYDKSELCEVIRVALDMTESNPVFKRNKDLEHAIGNSRYVFANHINLISIMKSRKRRLNDNDAIQNMFQFFTLNDTTANKNYSKFINIIKEWKRFGNRELRGCSKAIKTIKEKVKLIGQESNCSVLILGETGTGKETVANLIHGHSNRKDKLFLPINCAVLSPELQHSQLFGHRKGAFTGAVEDYDGLFKNADGGTIFLDELAELAPQVQSGLLRVLQEGTFSPLGAGNEEITVDVRIIAATNESLLEQVQSKDFREDLFYRIARSIIKIPPLRDRKEDIRPLVENILHRTNDTEILTDAHYEELQHHNWAGNVRELENILDRAKIEYFDSDKIKPNAFTALIAEQNALFATCADDNESEELDCISRKHCKMINAKYKGELSQKKIAKDILGISENTFKKWINS